MGKNTIKAPELKVPVPFMQEEGKEAYESNDKPPSVKLLRDASGEAIDNPPVQVHPIFNGGTVEQFFKWYKILVSIMEGH
jgi:hypothetical protein